MTSDGTAVTAAPPGLVEHTVEVGLRPNDFDWAGHLNNSVFPQLLESGRWEWGLANGVDLRDSTLVAVVLQLRLDYLKAVDWDPVGRLRIRTSLAGQTPYSFTLAQDVLLVDGTVAARGQVRLGLVDRETKAIHRVDLRGRAS
ncbi:acyl-CoA thioesterase [Streptomyces venezuelae ATCC 10712]